MIKLYVNGCNIEVIDCINIDPKYICGWYVGDSPYKHLVIFTSFGKIFELNGIPTWELKSEWDLTEGRKRLDAFNHNMAVLNEC